MSRTLQAEDLLGAQFDRIGDTIGEVRQVVRDPPTDRPASVGARVGGLEEEVLVPLDGADRHASTLHASVSRSSAPTAPPMETSGAPTSQEQERLLRHDGIPCVCTPREDIDLASYDGADLSYSVRDEPNAASTASR